MLTAGGGLWHEQEEAHGRSTSPRKGNGLISPGSIASGLGWVWSILILPSLTAFAESGVKSSSKLESVSVSQKVVSTSWDELLLLTSASSHSSTRNQDLHDDGRGSVELSGFFPNYRVLNRCGANSIGWIETFRVI
jgi:hypothetical protein